MATAIPIAPDLPTLPALKKLGKLADLRPVVIIDSREQTPLPIQRLETVRSGLQTADYSFVGGEQVFGVERKSIDDLVGCCMGGKPPAIREGVPSASRVQVQATADRGPAVDD